MRRQRGRAGLSDVGGRLLGDFEVEIGGFQRQDAVAGVDEHIGEDRNGRSALDDPVDMAERPKQRRSLDRNLHRRKTICVFLGAAGAPGAETLASQRPNRK
ncbi:hypothetical protein LMG27198_04350 [Methylocystis echinoides]|uniref:Uncharacterized protein n=1 Tax=Methylocystis echinoides TaxID=29468 RepID=A0A9W6GR82_9HYPH|nr:hypothetical protein LMG27198_04350 [Methylocystis echinoides]